MQTNKYLSLWVPTMGLHALHQVEESISFWQWYIDFVDKIDLIFEIPYERLGELEKLLKDYEAEIIEKSFLEKIIFKVKINKEFYDNLKNYPYINLLDI